MNKTNFAAHSTTSIYYFDGLFHSIMTQGSYSLQEQNDNFISNADIEIIFCFYVLITFLYTVINSYLVSLKKFQPVAF